MGVLQTIDNVHYRARAELVSPNGMARQRMMHDKAQLARALERYERAPDAFKPALKNWLVKAQEIYEASAARCDALS